jgi:uncharacterized protein
MARDVISCVDQLRPSTATDSVIISSNSQRGRGMMPDTRSDGTDLEPTVFDTEPFGEVFLSEDAGLGNSVQPGLSSRAEPVLPFDRFLAVDLLRGFALLGILAMNIIDFGWPWLAYGNPLLGGGFKGFDRVIWIFNHLVFEEKMMTLFSMLFGAGLVLMDGRAAAKGASIRGTYFRRIFWLFAIGLVHAYLIWEGDVLVLYAECGVFLYFFRKKTPRTLIALGVGLIVALAPLVLGFAAGIDYMKAAATKVDAKKKAGAEPTWLEKKAAKLWTEDLQKELMPTPEQRAKEWDKVVATHRGGYAGIVKDKAVDLVQSQTWGFLFGAGLFAGGRMLLGMGLMKLGVFSGERSRRFYLWLLLLGYGIGLPLMVYDAYELMRHEFSFDYELHGGAIVNLLGSVVVALGHVGLWMLIFKAGLLEWLTRRLAAVGRMALTNYLTHSIVCTTIFYGYGLGYYGTMNRTGLMAVVVAIWIAQLTISPIWLRYFRFGPAEWLWRSLTYWRRQPMRVVQPTGV